ncbi:MAG: putative transcriptional regulator [Planctomycetota bacterium]|nr:putative transcriptional regulator [Planctomycetota bacterium]
MNSLQGHLLIAAPSLIAPIFTRSIILMIDHDEDGAMGVILNLRIDATATDLAGKIVEDGFSWDKPLNLGGPVSGPLMVLHAVPDLADREIIPGVFLAIDADRVGEILSRKVEPSVIVVNYSGWSAGQLEGEFEWDSWLTLPATAEHVFGPVEVNLWETVVKQVSIRTLAEFFGVREVPPDPNMN